MGYFKLTRMPNPYLMANVTPAQQKQLDAQRWKSKPLQYRLLQRTHYFFIFIYLYCNAFVFTTLIFYYHFFEVILRSKPKPAKWQWLAFKFGLVYPAIGIFLVKQLSFRNPERVIPIINPPTTLLLIRLFYIF